MPTLPPQLAQALPDTDACAALLAELVRRYSPSGHEHDVQQFIHAWFRQRGIAAELRPAADGLLNVIATVDSGQPGPTLLLCGHTDTALPAAGWDTDPLDPVRDGNRLYGLGAMDMKAGVAAAMLAAAALAAALAAWHGRVIVAAVADEEAYSRGVKALLADFAADGTRVDGAIVCEPAFATPLLGCFGKVLVKADVLGKSAHGSMPHMGVNAITEAARFLAALDRTPLGKHPKLGQSSQCVLDMKGGPDTYVIQVPEHAAFSINRHIVPGETEATVLAQMEELAASLQSPATFQFRVEPPYYPPYLVDDSDPFVSRFAAAYRHVVGSPPAFGYAPFVCDANYIAADAGIPTVVFGPGGANMHAANEWADLDETARAAAVYAQLAAGFGAAPA